MIYILLENAIVHDIAITSAISEDSRHIEICNCGRGHQGRDLIRDSPYSFIVTEYENSPLQDSNWSVYILLAYDHRLGNLSLHIPFRGVHHSLDNAIDGSDVLKLTFMVLLFFTTSMFSFVFGNLFDGLLGDFSLRGDHHFFIEPSHLSWPW